MDAVVFLLLAFFLLAGTGAALRHTHPRSSWQSCPGSSCPLAGRSHFHNGDPE